MSRLRRWRRFGQGSGKLIQKDSTDSSSNASRTAHAASTPSSRTLGRSERESLRATLRTRLNERSTPTTALPGSRRASSVRNAPSPNPTSTCRRSGAAAERPKSFAQPDRRTSWGQTRRSFPVISRWIVRDTSMHHRAAARNQRISSGSKPCRWLSVSVTCRMISRTERSKEMLSTIGTSKRSASSRKWSWIWTIESRFSR
jgi:hypothetical protein